MDSIYDRFTSRADGHIPANLVGNLCFIGPHFRPRTLLRSVDTRTSAGVTLWRRRGGHTFCNEPPYQLLEMVNPLAHRIAVENRRIASESRDGRSYPTDTRPVSIAGGPRSGLGSVTACCARGTPAHRASELTGSLFVPRCAILTWFLTIAFQPIELVLVW